MAGVTSPSMKVYVVENVTHGNKAYSNLNEGYGKCSAMAPSAKKSLPNCGG
jgi:hypothetical protein